MAVPSAMNDRLNVIILKQSDYREKDVLLSVLSREYGKISFTAAGARKITSRNSASLLPYTSARFLFDYHPGRTMFHLRTAETISLRRHLHEDLNASAAAAVLCECADALLLPGEQSASAQMYDLLEKGLDRLDHGDDMTSVLALYLADVLRISGMAPDVDECTVCQKKEVSALSVQAGGFLCREDAAKLGVPASSAADLKRFRLICKAGLSHFDAVIQAGGASWEDTVILVDFLHQYGSIALQSFRFLQEICAH
jgi:DNA repair protein RecO (recombination protein O)